MVLNEEIAQKTASFLLQIKAIRLDTQNLFTWASGIKSPIYCDNRSTLSYPDIRSFIAKELANIVQTKFATSNAIAGVATGGIPHGALVADRVNKPFIYVRAAPKEHGLGNLIEGRIELGSKVVVVEDLVSTGKSSLFAVDALQKADIDVLGMIAIFDYGFAKAQQAFAQANCDLYTLCNYEILLKQAIKENYISSDDVDFLQHWKENTNR